MTSLHTNMADEPIACTRLACNGVVQCLTCRACAEHCECDPTPWEVTSGYQGPSAEQRADWQRMKHGR